MNEWKWLLILGEKYLLGKSILKKPWYLEKKIGVLYIMNIKKNAVCCYNNSNNSGNENNSGNSKKLWKFYMWNIYSMPIFKSVLMDSGPSKLFFFRRFYQVSPMCHLLPHTRSHSGFDRIALFTSAKISPHLPPCPPYVLHHQQLHVP